MSQSSNTEICGDRVDNDGNGQVDEGCGCAAGRQDCCAATFGKPVDATSGITSVEDQTDIRVSTPVPLVFTRRYVQRNSNYPLPAAPTDVTDRMVLGPGWSHTYDLEVEQVDNWTLVVSGGAQPDRLFKKDADPGTTYRGGVSGEVAWYDNGWIILSPDGTRAVFDSNNKLLHIRDRSSRGLLITRNSAGTGTIDKVTYYDDVVSQSGPGQYLKFAYQSNGMLSSVTVGASGPSWTFGYFQIYASAPTPWSPILSSVTHGTTTRTYEYQVLSFASATADLAYIPSVKYIHPAATITSPHHVD